MEQLTLGCDEAACVILERIAAQLPDATVDYECGAGVHYFSIGHAGTCFRVQFSEQTLMRKSVQEIRLAVAKVVERVRSSTTPGPVAAQAYV